MAMGSGSSMIGNRGGGRGRGRGRGRVRGIPITAFQETRRSDPDGTWQMAKTERVSFRRSFRQRWRQRIYRDKTDQSLLTSSPTLLRRPGGPVNARWEKRRLRIGIGKRRRVGARRNPIGQIS